MEVRFILFYNDFWIILSEQHSFNSYKNINPWENSQRLKVLSSHRITSKNFPSPPFFPLQVFKVIHKSSFYMLLNLKVLKAVSSATGPCKFQLPQLQKNAVELIWEEKEENLVF